MVVEETNALPKAQEIAEFNAMSAHGQEAVGQLTRTELMNGSMLCAPTTDNSFLLPDDAEIAIGLRLAEEMDARVAGLMIATLEALVEDVMNPALDLADAAIDKLVDSYRFSRPGCRSYFDLVPVAPSHKCALY